MLLGIGLHAAIPFVPWRGDDETGVWLLDVFVGFVHGFRMPLFFMISGFFTAMLWRRRGLRSLIRHRLRRVGLPLLVGCFTIIPAVWIGIISGWVISGEVTWEELESGEGVGAYEETLEEDLGSVEGDDATDRAVADSDAKSESAAGPQEEGEEGIGFAHLWFGFGALAYDQRARGGAPLMDVIGRRWVVQLTVAVVVMFPAGLALLEGLWSASALLQIVFAWTMSFGMIGLFRRFLSGARFRVHYLSDASYWMYMAHLPLVFVAQGIVTRLALPVLVDFVVVCASVTALLLFAYRYLVRFTFVGLLLNGRRTRAADRASRSKLAAAA